MITKYFTKVIVRFNPFGKEAKTARLFLASIPPRQRIMGTKIENELLNGTSTKEPIIKVVYKDKKEDSVDPRVLSFMEIANKLDGHSRQLRLKETIENH
ncbi:similar to Saccharomyces cerevisiae YMR225C MRPL44 Mitochondrial ribosomal protein of the large subunit [Maudiozyma saulgeensis]|uniref:Large ribosomal subunit protein mL53 n=1 Tax=Maudiozyma saulgeensis TaxID=1789683 RepID=A0A1X7RA45_9SACH|nr:similar to Saccharomyces cerevisiae YMR225C MRPL44 Mitochondrial ribosomal protein of the large subunit [Kazachstania saulgeensis]